MTSVPRRTRPRGQLPAQQGHNQIDTMVRTAKPGEHDPTLRPPEDAFYAIALLQGLCGGELNKVSVTTIYGDPPSKSRPMIVRGRAMENKADKMKEAATAAELAGHARYAGNAAMVCLFFRPNKQRIDADNMLKHVCDAANGVLWDDDSQCTAVAGVVEYDAGLPRTVVATAAHLTSMRRGADDILLCPCGNEYPRGEGRVKYCGPACAARARGHVLKNDPIPCKQCGEDFVRTTTAQVMCSPECRVESLRGRNRKRASPNSTCSTCGKQLAHKRGGRCRDCWRADASHQR